jgi:hypothetical protein
MALFRFHRGSLEESLKTTIIVNSMFEICDALEESSLLSMDMKFTVKTKPYPDKKNNFDSRIGWYTHAVLMKTNPKEEYQIVGFLSEDLAR